MSRIEIPTARPRGCDGLTVAIGGFYLDGSSSLGYVECLSVRSARVCMYGSLCMCI